jgi:hypothetical protein
MSIKEVVELLRRVESLEGQIVHLHARVVALTERLDKQHQPKTTKREAAE